MIAFDLPFVLAAASVALAGVVRGFSGFGAALVMVPALSVLYGPVVAVPTMVILEIVAALQLLPNAVRIAAWRTVLTMQAASVVTTLVGAWALVSLDADLMRRIIALVVLGSVAVLATGWRYRGKAGPAPSLAVGGFSGLLGGATGMSGPPVILFLLAGPFTAAVVRASLICYFALSQVVQIGAYAAHGIVTTEVLVRAAFLMPFFVVPIWLGSRLFGKAPEHLFRRLAFAILTVVALVALFA